jgi:pimeloyl-ACP methyl ester carboxylesterase
MAPADPKSRKLALATGLSYHLLEWGAADPSLDHSVFVLHGFLDSSCSWVATVDAELAGRFHVVVPDLRGHGDSDWVGAGGYYHFMDYLADLDSLIGQLGRGQVSLVGHSMGGSIASYYAGSFPARIARLALLEGTGPPDQSTPIPDRVATWLSSCQRVRKRSRHTYATIAEAAAKLRRHDPHLSAEVALDIAEHSSTGAGSAGFRFKHDPMHATTGPYPYRREIATSFWQRVTCPVLLVEGEKSAFRHPHAEAQSRQADFADARFQLLADAGHMMQRHQPAALSRLLADFLAAETPK